MIEILGENLKRFFDSIDKNCTESDITYAGNEYEVWKVSDELHEKMCDMSEEEFVELAGDDAWWRSSEGSVLGNPDYTFYINGESILAWQEHDRNGDYCKGCCDDDEEECYECVKESRSFKKLTEYLCNEIGASQPRNVCALSVDLAKYNNMTMGELFQKYEG